MHEGVFQGSCSTSIVMSMMEVKHDSALVEAVPSVVIHASPIVTPMPERRDSQDSVTSSQSSSYAGGFGRLQRRQYSGASKAWIFSRERLEALRKQNLIDLATQVSVRELENARRYLATYHSE